jgi:hypothetical protein
LYNISIVYHIYNVFYFLGSENSEEGERINALLITLITTVGNCIIEQLTFMLYKIAHYGLLILNTLPLILISIIK